VVLCEVVFVVVVSRAGENWGEYPLIAAEIQH
jgi:hypothetical protein